MKKLLLGIFCTLLLPSYALAGVMLGKHDVPEYFFDCTSDEQCVQVSGFSCNQCPNPYAINSSYREELWSMTAGFPDCLSYSAINQECAKFLELKRTPRCLQNKCILLDGYEKTLKDSIIELEEDSE